MIARLTRYTGPEEAIDDAVRKQVALKEHQADRIVLLRSRGSRRDALLVLWFGEESEEAPSLLDAELAKVDVELFDVVSPEEERAALRRACEALLHTMAGGRSPETEHIYEELEALSAKLADEPTAR